MKRCLLATIALAICAVAPAALGDWDPANPDPNTKWAQLPDWGGWDVKMTEPKILADDFLCTETGWITAVHFWGAWEQDDIGEITRVHVSFYDNIPPSISPTGYSIPGNELWSVDFEPGPHSTALTVREYGLGDQGWHDPNTGEAYQHDHVLIWQLNVFLDDLLLPSGLFFQEEGSIYWLGMQLDIAGGSDFGWNTSIDQWGDYAVWGDWTPGEPKPAGDEWSEPVITPYDLAFVITGIPIPEPGLFAIAGLGLIALLRRKK